MPPSPFDLTTERAVLRAFATDDAAELLRVFRDPDVRRGLLDDAVVSPEWVLDEIAASDARFARFGAGLWSVRLAHTPRIVGFAGFREFYDPPELQLLYGLLPAWQGRGLALEVTRRLCDVAFRELGFAEVTAATDLPNRASARLLGRLGMRLVRTDGAAGTAWFAVDRATWLAHAADATA